MTTQLILMPKIEQFSSMGKYLIDRLQQDSHLDLNPYDDHSSNLLIIKNGLDIGNEMDVINQAHIHKCMIVRIANRESKTLVYKNTEIHDQEIPLKVKVLEISWLSMNDAQVLGDSLVQDAEAFFLSENPKKAFPKLPRIPKCPEIVKDTSTLPPLYNSEGLTDFPTKGENKTPSFRNSQFPMFPFDLTLKIIEKDPKVWCAGGNQFGNKAFSYWIQVMKALHENKPVPTNALRWLKKREGYIARHRQDCRLAGTIAMIKWAGFIDGPNGRGNGAEDGSSLEHMLEIIGYK